MDSVDCDILNGACRYHVLLRGDHDDPVRVPVDSVPCVMCKRSLCHNHALYSKHMTSPDVYCKTCIDKRPHNRYGQPK